MEEDKRKELPDEFDKFDNFIIKECIAKGGASIAYKSIHKDTGMAFIIKEIYPFKLQNDLRRTKKLKLLS